MVNVKQIEIQDFPLWQKIESLRRPLFSFDLELTARCNNNCRHCYINLPANDKTAKAQELSIEEIDRISDEAVKLGALWVLITGGEPLLRKDFPEIYMLLKRKGLLINVFTNATLINPEHIALFKKYPPRDIEVSIYGASQKTYEAVSRVPGTFKAFQRGLEMLFHAGIPVRLKAMALKSNLEEIDEIAAFGKKYTKDFYRFDPVLHLRYDRNEIRNEEIRSERLSPQEVVDLEKSDFSRIESIRNHCDIYFIEELKNRVDYHLFHCGTGTTSFTLGYDGTFRLCSSLVAPGTTVNLRETSLKEAWYDFVPKVREMRTDDPDYLNSCNRCPIVNLCLNCPAHAYLETGKMTAVVPYFCQVAHERAKVIQDLIDAESTQ